MAETDVHHNEKLIYESIKSKVFLRTAEDAVKQIVKVLNIDFPTPFEINSFYNEYEILNLLPISGIRKCNLKTKEKDRHVLIFEYIEGDSLYAVFQKKKNDILDFLYIAIAICEKVGNIHQHNIIHRDINPFNIIVNLHQREITLIDFSSSTRIDTSLQYEGNLEKLQGHLSYISPEQTGRMNRIVDYRSDLYSLGICFYEMLTGEVPFKGDDALSLIHAQIAQIPRPPHVVNPTVPVAISKIVLRLLHKNAEDRYQSAFGVKHDLEQCLAQFQKLGTIAEFDIAKKDASGKFLLPQKLYGREEEIDQLIESFQRCSNGAQELMLVAGYSGTGKSALVNEIHKPITAQRGYYISGKYDQFQRSVPYFAIIQAFKILINILLTEGEKRLNKNAVKIQEALGEEGKVLTNVLPNLEHLIGVQPEVPEVGGNEAQARFNYVFIKFIHAVCQPEHPIVLFVDDLQWADSASLQLLDVLLKQSNGKYFMCIGAYRDNEVSASHPLINTINEIKATSTTVNTIHIGNLSLEHVGAIIADATQRNSESVSSLANLIYAKTAGNAFFTTKFLKSIANEKLLFFYPNLNQWDWDLQQISLQNISDNVVEFMSEKIRKMEGAVEFLKYAACIGNVFNIDLVKQISGLSAAAADKALFEALRDGLLIQIDENNIKFSHDRIQQAVYSLIEDAEKAKVHYGIGRSLRELIPHNELDNHLFAIVNQLNLGKDLIVDAEESVSLAILNNDAGKKAKANSAFQTSGIYYRTGIELLPEQSWKNHYDLSLALFNGACESAYLNGEFDAMDTYFESIEQNAKSVLEKIKSYETRILAFKAQNKLIEAINTGLDILDQLEEPLPRKANMLHVAKGLISIMIRLIGKDANYFLNLPQMKDPNKIAAMRIIADITSSVYWAMPNLLPLVVFKMMNISMKHGNNAVSCFAYGSYGVILCGVLGRMKKGNEFGELSLALLDKLDAKEWKAQIYVSPYALTLHWRNHVDVTLKPLQESFHIGLETGLIEFACVNTNIYCIHSFLSGKELKRLEVETKSYSESYRQMKQETNLNYNEVYRQAMLNFMGKSEDPKLLKGEAFDEEKMLAQNEERNDKTGTFFIYNLKLMLNYFFRDFKNAELGAKEARKLLEAVLAKFEIPNHHFYESLNALKLAEIEPRYKSKYLALSKKGQKALKTWAKDAPENFLHKYELIEAERLRVNKNFGKAAIYYQRAIENATQQRFVHEEALARELAGRYYLQINIKGLAEYYLKAAYTIYREWGAEAKLTQLQQEFPAMISSVNKGMSLSGLSGESMPYIDGEHLDFTTFIKSATTISSEVVLSKLLSVLLNNVVENAGAQKGFLMLFSNQELFIEAYIDLPNSKEEIMPHISPFYADLLAESALKYAIRTKQNLVIMDATTNNQFLNDKYVVNNNVHSIMCLPVINQGKFIGLLYLENAATTGAFTQDRVELLSLLSSQIAISIDNALLYESLEQKVNDRTEELSKEKKKSDDLLYNILPYETAQEIKLNGKAEPRFYPSASVLFTDFQGFTNISANLSPSELVIELNECFKAFDEIVEKYGVEKIKTIGDAYMAVGGVPVPSSIHTENVIKAAIDIREFIANRKASNQGIGFELRIGVHTGPVVSGIVGTKKFQYDIWGDTVNIAARMESNSEPGKINISESTYQIIKDQFECEYRGEMDVKGKGNMRMYFVK